jgi:Tol biopolymer transport system component
MGTGVIVSASPTSAGYGPLTPLPPAINATGREIYPCIAPDESFLLFMRANEDRTAAIYVSFRRPDKTWSDPQKLELGLKNASMPSLSPDGKYLFFTSVPERLQGDIYWVNAGVIEALRPKR